MVEVNVSTAAALQKASPYQELTKYSHQRENNFNKTVQGFKLMTPPPTRHPQE